MTAAEANAGSGPGSAGGVFSPRVVLAVILVGVIAFGAFLVLQTYAPELRGGNDGGGHALSRSAVGFTGVVRLLQASGVPVVVVRGAPPAAPQRGAGPTPSVLVLTPSVDVEQADFRRATEGGGLRVVVLPKWITGPSPRRQGWVRSGGVRPEAAITAVGKDVLPPFTVERRRGASPVRAYSTNGVAPLASSYDLGTIQSLQTVSGDRWAPLLFDDEGRTLVARGTGADASWVLVADPDLLNNQGAATLPRMQAVIELIQTLRRDQGTAPAPVLFDISLNGFERARGLLRTAFEPPFLAATLIFLAAGVLMGLHAAARFGPQARTRRVFALGKTALADNAAGLIALAGREARLLPAYAADTRAAVAREVGAPRGLDGAELAAFLDRIGRSLNTTDAWSDLDRDAQNAADPLDVAQRIRRWREEMTHGRR